MSEHNDANDTDDAHQNDEGNVSLSDTKMRWIIGSGVLLILAVLVVSIFKEYMNERIKFVTDAVPNILIFAAVLIQARIYQLQWRVMRDQVRIMGVAYDPRLRVTDVRVENFRAGGEPVFIVLIKNEGATDARDTSLNIRVSFGHPIEGTLAQKWKEPQTVTVSAGQEQTYIVPWDSPIKQEHIDGFNNKTTPLTVSGFIRLKGRDPKKFCYRYYPIKGERPKGVPQFVPCDFDTGLARVVTPQAARLKLTAHAPDVISQPKPSGESKAQEETKPDSKDDEKARTN